MQLDHTEIVIRQRSTLELLDMSLLVLRRHIRSILISTTLLGIPLLLIDCWAIHWMLSDSAYLALEHLDDPLAAQRWRHSFHLVLLFTLQFPLITLPTTIFLGNQIFFQPIDLKELTKKLRQVAVPAVIVLGITRLGLLAIAFELLVSQTVGWDWMVEFWLLLVPGCVVLVVRACWPFAPEILGLELCKLSRRNKEDITYAQRSRGLHRFLMADHLARFFSACVFSILLAGMLLALSAFVQGVTTGTWTWNNWFNWVVLPIVLWCTGTFMAVFRFLCYLDARIRLEGWEIELRLKAEAGRLKLHSLPAQIDSQDKPAHVVPSQS